MKTHMFIIIAVCGLLFASCGGTTRITGSWKNPEVATPQLESSTMFIASLSRNIEVRTKLENALAEQAAQHNIRAVKSVDRFTPEFYKTTPTKEDLLGKIRESDAKVILTVSLINKESESRYVPGSRTYAPYPSFRWYRGFYAYYNYWYPLINDPGYYVTDKTYFIETNLYDAATDQLLWSAQSETVNPGSIDNFVRDYPKVLMAQMVKDGVLVAR